MTAGTRTLVGHTDISHVPFARRKFPIEIVY